MSASAPLNEEREDATFAAPATTARDFESDIEIFGAEIDLTEDLRPQLDEIEIRPMTPAAAALEDSADDSISDPAMPIIYLGTLSFLAIMALWGVLVFAL